MSETKLPEWLAASGVSADIGEIAAYIHALRNDLTDFYPTQPGGAHIPGARAELGAVVAGTEDAANKIMDACDSLSQAMNSKDAERNEKFSTAINAIYEACSFQDLTSQRVVKVQRTLDVIEHRLTELALKLGVDPQAAMETASVSSPEDSDAWLMNGPALPGASAVDQGDIDKLFG